MCISWVLSSIECLFCYDPSTSKMYVSKHVRFVESIFPFASLSLQSPRPQSTTISTWAPLIIKIPNPTNTLPPLMQSSEVEIQSASRFADSTSQSLSHPPPDSSTATLDPPTHQIPDAPQPTTTPPTRSTSHSTHLMIT